jgi:2-keto-3-deoxy-L-fuconate dehydrogenase
MFSLQNKQAVITGAGSGIGRAVAELFASQGAVVHAVDLNADALNAIETGVKSSGGSIKTYPCDVTDQKQVHKIFSEIGMINILVNSAGISHIGNATNTEVADFERVFNVNVKGVYNCLHEAIPLMKVNGGGVIINLASIAGSIGLSDRFAYSMSTGAVYAMTLSVAKDFIKEGIRCNCVSPARVHTPFVDGFLKKNYPGKEDEMFEKLSKAQPIGRMGTPREIAHLILYLSSDEASFITGSDYPIDGGAIKLNN